MRLGALGSALGGAARRLAATVGWSGCLALVGSALLLEGLRRLAPTAALLVAGAGCLALAWRVAKLEARR